MDFSSQIAKSLLVTCRELIETMQMGSQEGNYTDTKKIIFQIRIMHNADAVSINNYQMAVDSLPSFINISLHNIGDDAHIENGNVHSGTDGYNNSVMVSISSAC